MDNSIDVGHFQQILAAAGIKSLEIYHNKEEPIPCITYGSAECFQKIP